MLYIDDLPGYSDSSKDYDFRYENLKAGAGFRVTGDKPIIKLAYWSSTTTVCAEPYIKVEVQPGEEITWELKYEFYQLKN